MSAWSSATAPTSGIPQGQSLCGEGGAEGEDEEAQYAFSTAVGGEGRDGTGAQGDVMSRHAASQPQCNNDHTNERVVNAARFALCTLGNGEVCAKQLPRFRLRHSKTAKRQGRVIVAYGPEAPN